MNTNKHIDQIHALNQAFAEAEQQLMDEIAALNQREQEVAAQLLAVQQQAEKQRGELARSHSERERSLHDQYAEKETAFHQQLQAGRQELQRLQLELAQREKDHAEQTNQVRQELQTLLRHQILRDQDVAAQLLAIQQQAEQERTSLARSHSERERSLHKQYAEKVKALQDAWHTTEAEWSAHHSKEVAALAESVRQSTEEHQKDVEKLKQEVIAPAQLAAAQWQARAEAQTRMIDGLQQELSRLRSGSIARFLERVRLALGLQPQASILDTLPAAMAELQTLGAADIPIQLPVGTSVWSYAQTATKKRSNTDFSQPDPMKIQHVNDLLALHGEELVNATYRALLGREPDPLGLHYYVNRLINGLGKASIIAQIALSKEAKERFNTLAGLNELIKQYKKERKFITGWWHQIKNIRSKINRLDDLVTSQIFTLSKPRSPSTSATLTLQMMMLMSNEDFVSQAYAFILNRQPDNDGFKYFLDEIKTGKKNKLDVFCSIAQSQESLKTNIYGIENMDISENKCNSMGSITPQSPLLEGNLSSIRAKDLINIVAGNHRDCNGVGSELRTPLEDYMYKK